MTVREPSVSFVVAARVFGLVVAGIVGAAGTAGVSVSMSACGASYQAVYEGEVRFEHCYRLDEEPGIPPDQVRMCWKDWAQHYTFGQTRDRLEYALRRQRELTAQIAERDQSRTATLSTSTAASALLVPTLAPMSGPMTGPTLGPTQLPQGATGSTSTLSVGARGEPAAAVVAPAPTTPFAPPPAVHDKSSSSSTTSATSATSASSAGRAGDSGSGSGSGSSPPSPGQACLAQCLGELHSCKAACASKSKPECAGGCDRAFEACCVKCL